MKKLHFATKKNSFCGLHFDSTALRRIEKKVFVEIGIGIGILYLLLRFIITKGIEITRLFKS